MLSPSVILSLGNDRGHESVGRRCRATIYPTVDGKCCCSMYVTSFMISYIFSCTTFLTCSLSIINSKKHSFTGCECELRFRSGSTFATISKRYCKWVSGIPGHRVGLAHEDLSSPRQCLNHRSTEFIQISNALPHNCVRNSRKSLENLS